MTPRLAAGVGVVSAFLLLGGSGAAVALADPGGSHGSGRGHSSNDDGGHHGSDGHARGGGEDRSWSRSDDNDDRQRFGGSDDWRGGIGTGNPNEFVDDAPGANRNANGNAVGSGENDTPPFEEIPNGIPDGEVAPPQFVASSAPSVAPAARSAPSQVPAASSVPAVAPSASGVSALAPAASRPGGSARSGADSGHGGGWGMPSAPAAASESPRETVEDEAEPAAGVDTPDDTPEPQWYARMLAAVAPPGPAPLPPSAPLAEEVSEIHTPLAIVREFVVAPAAALSDPPLWGLAGLILLPAAGAALGYRHARAAQAAERLQLS